VIAFLVVLLIGWLPGLIAEQRGHRHPLLVSLVGFAGFYLHPLLWVAALVWAWKGATNRPPV
jgi:hypothetical protein